MPRPLAAVAAAAAALPAATLANPSISVSSARDGSTKRLPAKVIHRLTLTAGATTEEVAVEAVHLADRRGGPLPRHAQPTGRYVVSGTADPDVDSGHVELWAFAPGREKATRLGRVRVRDGGWAVKDLALNRRGNWELYARYRTARPKTFADDTSQCGTFVRVRRRAPTG